MVWRTAAAKDAAGVLATVRQCMEEKWVEHADFISRLTMVSMYQTNLGHGGGEVLFMLFMPGSREALETCSLLIAQTNWNDVI